MSKTISARTTGSGCPYCCSYWSNNWTVLCHHESLELKFPDLARSGIHTTVICCRRLRVGVTHKFQECGNANSTIYEAKNVQSNWAQSGCPCCKHKTERKLFEALLPYTRPRERQFRVDWKAASAKVGTTYPWFQDRKIPIELTEDSTFSKVELALTWGAKCHGPYSKKRERAGIAWFGCCRGRIGRQVRLVGELRAAIAELMANGEGEVANGTCR
jgi:hypothetical protein